MPSSSRHSRAPVFIRISENSHTPEHSALKARILRCSAGTIEPKTLGEQLLVHFCRAQSLHNQLTNSSTLPRLSQHNSVELLSLSLWVLVYLEAAPKGQRGAIVVSHHHRTTQRSVKCAFLAASCSSAAPRCWTPGQTQRWEVSALGPGRVWHPILSTSRAQVCLWVIDFVTFSPRGKKKKKVEKEMVKHKHLKNVPLIASYGQNQLNSDAKLLFAKLHESIIRSHFISVL